MITIAGFVVVAAGGAGARALVLRRYDAVDHLPWGTLAVNISGSFALGLAAGWDQAWLTVLGVAGLGAYTTFSTFAVELVRLHQDRRTSLALVYLLAMMALCVATAWLGLSLS